MLRFPFLLEHVTLLRDLLMDRITDFDSGKEPYYEVFQRLT